MEMKGTRFSWKIENFSCLEDGELQSPWFSSHSLTWEVQIYNNNNSLDNEVHFYLSCSKEKSVYCTFNCSIAFLDLEGSPLIWQEKKKCRSDMMSISVCSLSKDKIGQLKEKLIPNGTLTVECRIWQTDDELIQVRTCFALTRLEPVPEVIEKKFTLKTARVTSLQPGSIKESVYSMTRLGDTIKIRLFLDEDEEIKAEFALSLARVFVKCKISLLGATGKLTQFSDGEFDFGGKDTKWKLSTHITRDMLRCNKLNFLPNDTLTLVFAFTFSFTVTFSRIVKQNETRFYSRNLSADDYNWAVPRECIKDKSKGIEQQPTGSDPPVTINQALRNMYEEEFMSDFSLRVQDKTFPVHKNILGARSSVFRAMFTADMKEKESGSVDIPDVDADTIQRMLQFVYCDSVQSDMQWESASNLYAAADKYALEPLKQKCCDILKSELSGSSVLGILLIADKYQEQNLKSEALEFIARNDKLIIGTGPWCKFEEENPQTAIDVLRKLYVKKMNG